MEYIVLITMVYLFLLAFTTNDKNFVESILYRLIPFLLGIGGVYVATKLFNLI